MEQQLTTYAGMLDQNGFKQWYGYQKLRMEHQLDADEVSFLMGKPPFYFRDYAMLAPGSKLSYEDQQILSTIFNRDSPTLIEFEKDDKSILEKRLVRVRLKPKAHATVHQIAVPWAVRGKDNANRLTIRQEQWLPTLEEETKMRKQVESAVKKLTAGNYFRSYRSPLSVYREVDKDCRCYPILRPTYLKDALYQQIGLRRLSLKTINGQLAFYLQQTRTP